MGRACLAERRASLRVAADPANLRQKPFIVILDDAVSVAAAHQAHGAIGMTKEYPLHYLTRRLWAWRTEGGGHHRWADLLGHTLVEAGPDALYPAIQSGSAVVTAVPR